MAPSIAIALFKLVSMSIPGNPFSKVEVGERCYLVESSSSITADRVSPDADA